MMELQELVVSLQQLKSSSSELSNMVSAAGQSLSTQARNIALSPVPAKAGSRRPLRSPLRHRAC